MPSHPARVVHPWDGDDEIERRAVRFVEQALADTDTAIDRLFEVIPYVDVLSITVLDPSTGDTIMRVTVSRFSLTAAGNSAKMRLLNRGVAFAVNGSRFVPLDNATPTGT